MTLDLPLAHIEVLAPYFRGKAFRGTGTSDNSIRLSTMQLIDEHFSKVGMPNHPCRPSLQLALERLNNEPALIVETGSAAYGTKSTLLFDAYVNRNGGFVHSVDIRCEPLLTLLANVSPSTILHCNDSVEFLSKFSWGEARGRILVYLDSYDLDVSNPIPSASHCFQEFLLCLPQLAATGGILLIDDTPVDFPSWFKVQGSSDQNRFDHCKNSLGFYPGKGGAVVEYIRATKIATIVHHGYQVLCDFSKSQ